MKTLRPRYWLSAAISLIPPLGQATECTQIHLLYNERAPYMITTPRGVAGVTATMTTEVFKLAQIDAQWRQIPFTRQLKTIEANIGCDCLAGLFLRLDRLAYSRFTVPLYRDQPQYALVRDVDNRIRPGDSIFDILKRRDLVLEVKANYSYGAFLDQHIAQLKPIQDVTTGENGQMLKKIAAERADYMFISPLEAEALIDSTGFPRGIFRLVPLADMPPGEERHIMCSLRVSTQLIQRLNDAIALHKAGKRPGK